MPPALSNDLSSRLFKPRFAQGIPGNIRDRRMIALDQVLFPDPEFMGSKEVGPNLCSLGRIGRKARELVYNHSKVHLLFGHHA
jgi:hypothetical protein